MRTRARAFTAALIAALAACTNQPSSEVATGQSPGQSAPMAQGNPSAAPDPSRFAACLRERGIDVPDPQPGQQVRLLSKDDKTRSALRACARFAPPSQQEETGFDPAAARAYAQCIREHGFPDFPDPDERGPRIPKDVINDERFNVAERECARHLNGAKGNKQ